MVSKQQRETERRRAEKAEARFVRAAKVRRERQIVALVLVAVLAIGLGAVASVLSNRDGDDPVPAPSDTATTAPAQPTEDAATDEATDSVTEEPTDAEATPAPLPTTNPRLFEAAPPAIDSLGTTWTVTLETNAGDIVLELDGEKAPQAVSSFVMLSGAGFFDGTACHRLVTGALLQCGDPTATGTGGPGYTFGPIENAPADGVYPEGTVAMARQGGNGESMGSQFFLVYADVPLPDDDAGGYTVFGTVVQGLDVLQAIGAAGTTTGTTDGRPASDVIIEKAVIS